MPTIRSYFLLVFAISVLSSCNNKDIYVPISVSEHSSGEKFVTSSSCLECHQDIYHNHLKTAHYLSSSLGTSSTIGDFTNGEKSLIIEDSLIIKIEQKNNAFYHNAYNLETGEIIDQKPIDIVIGSGTKGKTYLYWQNDSLYQLHASYFSKSNSLIKSPGYFAQQGLQNKRPITERCLECHTTFAQTKSNKNTYDSSKLLLGIDCQRCHGPSEKHVTFHKNNPDALQAKYMLAINSLTRQQQMDLCALCHSGPRKHATQPRFSYKVGDYLNQYSTQDYFSTAIELDVHGNQVGMLSASKCFQKSEKMTCVTCHDPHKNQRNKTSFFLNKCIECHDKANTLNCPLEASQKGEKNCINCHMPKVTSKTMFAKNTITKDTINLDIVSHLIRIYEKK